MARLLLTGLALASATLELTPDNFDKEVTQSGKAVSATPCTIPSLHLPPAPWQCRRRASHAPSRPRGALSAERLASPRPTSRC